MTGLTIGWEYLTGYAVATDPSSRDRAEWPPHPARVFMALAAAWFETGEDPAEGEALHWLEGLGDPELVLPPLELVTDRSIVTLYVPVNDSAGPSPATLQSAPAMTRSRQPRSFPKCFVGDRPCFMHWAVADGFASWREALQELCAKVTRIGHSSSLVRMWIEEESDEGVDAHYGSVQRFVVDPLNSAFRTRRIAPGFLKSLKVQYGAEPRERRAMLESEIATLKSERKSVAGAGAKERKTAIDSEVQSREEELTTLVVSEPVRPRVGLWRGYRFADRVEIEIAKSHFDHDMLVLVHARGERPLSLSATLAVTGALRETIMSLSVIQPVPSWMSGHQSDGSPDDSGAGHLAFVPLAFVDSQQKHASGALYGMGIVFPRNVQHSERGRVLGPILIDEQGGSKEIELRLGKLGTWRLIRQGGIHERSSTIPETWTASPDAGSSMWASATPVVLDRFPKVDRTKDPEGWETEVGSIIRASCVRIGLPEPNQVGVRTTSWLYGSPRATTKQRRLRGYSDGPALVSLGEGFPQYPSKSGSGPRLQVHVALQFDEPVVGPVMLGAGRYRGYGVFKPLREEAKGPK